MYLKKKKIEQLLFNKEDKETDSLHLSSILVTVTHPNYSRNVEHKGVHLLDMIFFALSEIRKECTVFSFYVRVHFFHTIAIPNTPLSIT